MAFFSHRNDDFDLREEVAALRRQLAALSRATPRRGAEAWRDARDDASALYEDLSERVADAMPVIRRRARHVEEAIRDNPVPVLAAVGLVALGVAAALMLGNSGKR